MEQSKKYSANEGKSLERTVEGKTYERIPVKTHFVKAGEDYIELIKKYVMPFYQKGDFLVSSEKVLALCQEDIIYKKDLKVTPLAKILSSFAMKNPAGPAMDNVYKMQAAIKLAGPIRIIIAAIIGGLGKLIGKRGLFYKIAGKNVGSIDGFCVVAFEYYSDKGILAPSNPEKACDSVKSELGLDCVVVDANDLDVEILGKNKDMPLSEKLIKDIIIDNPAGQGYELTPFILIREIESKTSPEELAG